MCPEPVKRSTQCRAVLNLRAHAKRVDVFFSSVRDAREANTVVGCCTQSFQESNIRDTLCYDLKFAMSKGDRLHVHICELHRFGTVRKSVTNAHGQIGARHWCFRCRPRQSLPQSRHPSFWPWPWPLVNTGKEATVLIKACFGRRQGQIPDSRPRCFTYYGSY